jgi:hypothetical protein
MERLIQNSGDIRHPKRKSVSDSPEGAKNSGKIFSREDFINLYRMIQIILDKYPRKGV